MIDTISPATVWRLLPEILLMLWATAIYVLGAFLPARRVWNAIAIVGLAVVAFVVAQQQSALAEASDLPLVSGPAIFDSLTMATRSLVLGLGLLFLLMSGRSISAGLSAEYAGSLLLILAGLMLVAAAGDLVLLFLGLELVSIPTYIVLYLGRDDFRCQEAAAKYFFLSILSSAILLYGLTFLYGATGSTRLSNIDQQLTAAAAAGGASLFAKIAVLLILAGLGFRLTVVPFQFYAPDVYQGTSNVNAGILSVLPKVAGLAAMLRLLVAALPAEPLLQQLPLAHDAAVKLHEMGWQLCFGIAVLSMTYGNLVALRQTHLRRLMAYSSIAHAGYLFVGLATGLAVTGSGADTQTPLDGVAATLFYLVAYSVATTGVFAVLSYLDGSYRPTNTLDDLAGLGAARPVAALGMSLFMFSLIGVPPLAGFWGKFSLLIGTLGVDAGTGSAIRWWFLALAISTVLNAAIAAAYYLRVVGTMYFRQADPAAITSDAANAPPTALGYRQAPGALAAVICCAALTVALGLAPSQAVSWSAQAAEAPRATMSRLQLERASQAARLADPTADFQAGVDR